MKKAYWNCEVQKNWNGELREEMLQQNIFCYGKPGDDKTEKVVRPFLRHAIERGNSIILASKDQHLSSFKDLYRMAKEAGYEMGTYDPYFYPEYSTSEIDEEGQNLMQALMSGQVFIWVDLNACNRYRFNSVSAAIQWLHHAERKELEYVEFGNVSLVMEDANWEIFVPDCAGACNWLNFCITADCRRLAVNDNVESRYQYIKHLTQKDYAELDDPNFRGQVRDAAETGDIMAVRKLLDQNIYTDELASRVDPRIGYRFKNVDLIIESNSYLPDEALRNYAKDTLYTALTKFFYNVQTVICTGLAGIVPAEQKSFLQAFVLTPGIPAPGGKFLITELTAPDQPIPRSMIPKTVLKVRNASAEKWLENDFVPGKCVVEQNGVVKMYADWEGSLVPMCFATASRAMDWLELYFSQMGWGWPEPVEMDSCSFRYLLPTVNDRGEQDDIIISYIQETDVQAYVDQSMMVLMSVQEYLAEPSLMSEIPNIDRKRDAGNITLQKIANYACRHYHQVRKIVQAELPVNAETQEPVASLFQEYQWRPYQKAAVVAPPPAPETALDILPAKKILFLGGHANMVKKLRQIFPDWSFLTDDELGCWTGGECEVIFFWSKHCSHLIQQYVNARKSKNAPYIYVTATNIDRLISEMAQKYSAYKASKGNLAAV